MRYFFLVGVLLAETAAADAQPVGVNYFYGFDTPLVSAISGLQIGPSPSVVARQGSAVNVFQVEQIGPVTFADVTQSGYANRAGVIQIGAASPFVAAGQ
jgi:hypothetical protein